MAHSQHPLVLTNLLREVMNLPSPPPISPGTPPPEVQERIERLDRLAREAYLVSPTSSLGSPAPTRMSGFGPWVVGNTTATAPTGGNKITEGEDTLAEQH